MNSEEALGLEGFLSLVIKEATKSPGSRALWAWKV